MGWVIFGFLVFWLAFGGVVGTMYFDGNLIIGGLIGLGIFFIHMLGVFLDIIRKK